MRLHGKVGQHHVGCVHRERHERFNGVEDGGGARVDVFGDVPEGEALLHTQGAVDGLEDGREAGGRAMLQFPMVAAEDKAATEFLGFFEFFYFLNLVNYFIKI